MAKTSVAQLEASTKWQRKNVERMRQIRNRSGAKRYIKHGTLADLDELQKLINTRREKLQKSHD